MTLSEELQWRGFVNQTTFKNLVDLDKQPLTFYHGFDASADSQTVGNLAAMMLDRCFMRHGYKAIILAGGATSLIGDPGGKDVERQLQSPETIADNVARAQEQLKKVFSGYDFTLVNNLDWTIDLKVIDFLRDIGKHFSMTPLIQRDYIAKRLGEGSSGISYAEFSYTILQGMDYLHLFDKYGCTLQLGGSDQWGNCLSGVDLIRRTRSQEVNVITLPLIVNKTTDKKFGKSEDGAIWLDAKKTSPTEFYQFWINLSDEGVEDYLKIYTELSKAEIDEIMAKHQERPAERYAQTRLAEAVTKLVHDDHAANLAGSIVKFLNGQKHVGDASDEELEGLRGEIANTTAKAGEEIAEVLVKTGLVPSKTEGRRVQEGGGIYLNGTGASKESLDQTDFKNGRLLIRRGKAFKDSALVELEQ